MPSVPPHALAVLSSAHGAVVLRHNPRMVRRIAIIGSSMEPTLHSGDWLLYVRSTRLRPGSIAVFRHPGRSDLVVVKRAVERHPDGSWWMLGDNPAASEDSRAFGAVPASSILGRVLFRYRSTVTSAHP